MNCQNKIMHTVRPGDTLYRLAHQYNTTVEDILMMNPGLDPRDLQVARHIIICPNTPQNQMPPQGMSPAYVGLQNDLRQVWEEHIMYTRMVMMSVLDSLPNDSAVTKRLLQNPGDMAAIFRKYYGDDVASQIQALFTEHLALGKEYFTALKNKNADMMAAVDKQWYENADQIAAYLASINPYINQKEMQEMMHTHLDLLKIQAENHANGNYTADIAAYDEGELRVLEMADFWAQAMQKQKPQDF